ncbi:hypothetical protein [Streptomyces spiramenti]|uniref:Integral membrane protein n=1 Tax=Streptomyces spiramenti TaxID=2720606 RepID=A0ABX1AV73_9ACTN|nr:hypothetical protein [Streptomyces spiramenti]NJP68172.1 hypothetical protein [Streptomyces spiramenti]
MRRSRALAIGVRVFFATVPVWSLGLLGWVPALRIAIVRRRSIDRALAAAAVVLTVAYVAVIGSTPEETTDWSVAQNAAFGLLLLALVPGAVIHACLADLPLPPRRGDLHRAVPAGYGYPAPGYPQPGTGYGSPGPGYGPPAGSYAPTHYGYAPQGGWAAPGGPPASAPAGPAPHHPPYGSRPQAAPAPTAPVPAAHTPEPHTPAPRTPVPHPATEVNPSASDSSAPAPAAPPRPADSSSRLRQAASELDELGELLRDQDDRR